MKSFLYTTLILFAFFIPLSAFAKTEGHYLGADYIRSKLKFYEYRVDATHISSTGSRYSHDHWGGGLNYKYAFNLADSLDCLGVKAVPSFLEKFFVAPGLIYEANNVKARKTSGRNRNTELAVKNRYGAKVDVGYDINDYFAPYFTVGYVGVYYKSINYASAASFSDFGETKTANVYDWFYGAGLKIDYNQNIAFNFEYNRERFKAKTSTSAINDYTGIFISRFEVFKMGAAYRF